MEIKQTAFTINSHRSKVNSKQLLNKYILHFSFHAFSAYLFPFHFFYFIHLVVKYLIIDHRHSLYSYTDCERNFFSICLRQYSFGGFLELRDYVLFRQQLCCVYFAWRQNVDFRVRNIVIPTIFVRIRRIYIQYVGANIAHGNVAHYIEFFPQIIRFILSLSRKKQWIFNHLLVSLQ